MTGYGSRVWRRPLGSTVEVAGRTTHEDGLT